jgi:hypothetical protein
MIERCAEAVLLCLLRGAARSAASTERSVLPPPCDRGDPTQPSAPPYKEGATT